MSKTPKEPIFVQPHELQLLIGKDKSLMIIDVRSTSEYIRNHIPNSFSISSMKQLPRHLEGVDRNLTVVIVSKNGGGFAASIADMFTELGFEKVSLLAGGMYAWEETQMYFGKNPSELIGHRLH